MNQWIVGMLVGLTVAGAACSRDQKAAQIAALDEAYRSGVLSKTEYDAKKAALTAPPQVAALDEAYRAGVLSQAEYEAKRAAMLGTAAPVAAAPAYVAAAQPAPQAPAAAAAQVMPVQSTPAQATRAQGTPVQASPQLSALEEAYKAGILSKQEYEARRAALAGGAPAPAGAPAMQTPPPAGPQYATAPPPAAAGRSNFLVLRKAALMDQSGFERPLPVATMLVPSDWQTQGGTQWNTRDACNPIRIEFRAMGPDGRGLEVFPPYTWQWADDPTMLRQSAAVYAQTGTRACDIMPPMSAGDFVRRNLGRVRPNAQIVSMEPMPKLIQGLQQQAQQTQQMAAQYGLRQVVRPDAVRVRLRYSLNGMPVEEWVIATTTATGTVSPGMNMAGQMTQNTSYTCSASWIAERAPQGQLEASERLFEMILSTARANPEWVARVSKNSAAIYEAQRVEVGKRAEIGRQLNQDLTTINQQAYWNRQRSQDRLFAQFSQATLGVETYRNPVSGETFDLSNEYRHAWVNNRNEIVLSDQEGWDPNVALKGDWTAMQHVRP